MAYFWMISPAEKTGHISLLHTFLTAPQILAYMDERCKLACPMLQDCNIYGYVAGTHVKVPNVQNLLLFLFLLIFRRISPFESIPTSSVVIVRANNSDA